MFFTRMKSISIVLLLAFFLHSISARPEPEYDFIEEEDLCEIYFAGSGTNFGPDITQQDIDKHLTYQ